MANAFKQAVAKAKAPGKAAKPPETVWTLPEDHPAQEALATFLAATKRGKEATAEADGAKTPLVDECLRRWLAHLADNGARPGSTMRLVGAAGLAVTFVTKEERLPCDDATLERLYDLIGEKADDLVSEEVSIKLDAALLALPTAKAAKIGGSTTLFDWLGEKLGGILTRGVKSGDITQEQADGLIVAEKRRVITAGYIDAIASECKGDRERIESGLASIGGVKRHVQA